MLVRPVQRGQLVYPCRLVGLKPPFDCGLALVKLFGLEVVQGQCLLPHKHLLWLIIPRQRLGNLLRTPCTTAIPSSRQPDRAPLTPADAADYREIGGMYALSLAFKSAMGVDFSARF